LYSVDLLSGKRNPVAIGEFTIKTQTAAFDDVSNSVLFIAEDNFFVAVDMATQCVTSRAISGFRKGFQAVNVGNLIVDTKRNRAIVQAYDDGLYVLHLGTLEAARVAY